MESIIVTIKSVNYGNRLQNYAVYQLTKKLSLQPKSLYIQDLRKKTVIRKSNGVLKKILKAIIPMSILKRHWKKRKFRTVMLMYCRKKKIAFLTSLLEKI